MKGKVYFIGGEYDGEVWDHQVRLGDVVPRIKCHPIGDVSIINNLSPHDTVKEDLIKYEAEFYSVAGDKRIFLVDPELPREQAIRKIEKYFF